MAHLAIDDAAWTNRWRQRSTFEKALLASGLLAVAITIRQPLVGVAVMAVSVTAALVGARVPVAVYARALLAPLVFILIGVGSIAISLGDAAVVARGTELLISFGPVHITEASLIRAIDTSVRSFAAMSALVLLATTTPVIDLLRGLRRLRVPDALIDIAALTYRMLFSLLDAQHAIRETQAARLGYSSGTNARRSIGLLAAGVFRRAWVRSRRLEAGLLGRGYEGTLSTVTRPRPVSGQFIAGALLVIFFLAVLSYCSPRGPGIWG